MQVRKLNLHNAFQLAGLLSKYKITIDSPSKDALDFIAELVDKLSPPDFLHCVNLVTGLDAEEIVKHPSIEILTVFIEGLKLNQIITLISFYESMAHS